MAARVRGCEALLANGETITWSADCAGPSLIGTLPQANVAVVTRLTLQLDPAPHFSQFSAVYLNDTDALARCIDALRDLLQRGAGRVQLEFMNDYRFMAQRRQFPYDAFDGSVPLPRARVGEHLGLPARPQWIAGLTAWADSEHELALRRSMLDARLRHGLRGSR